MDIRKHLEFFNPADAPPIHIVGCGAIGSTIANMIARLGINEIHLWDMDHVETKNIANQTFKFKDVTKPKTLAVLEHIKEINPAAIVHQHNEYTMQKLKGIVFTTVDSVEVRKNIIKYNRYSPDVMGYIDVRMRLTSGQLYTAEFIKQDSVDRLLNTLNFTDEEAKSSTPISACGTVLNVRPNVTLLSSYAVSELMHMVINGKFKHRFMMADVFHHTLEVM